MMRRLVKFRAFAAIAFVIILFGYPVACNGQRPDVSQLQPKTEAQFVFIVYGELKANFYNPANLDPAILFNSSLDGLAKYLKEKKVNFSPVKITAGADEATAKTVFETEFGKAENLASGIKLEPHELAFVASGWLLEVVDDSHTGFVSPKRWAESQKQISGKPMFAGIGATIKRTEDGFFYCINLFPGAPAEKAGLKRFDRIIAVDGISVPSETDDLIGLIRGEKCSEVVVTVLRNGKRMDFTVERNDIVVLISQEELITSGAQHFGYLHLYTFMRDEALGATLSLVVSGEGINKVDGYIVDLRNNSGGKLGVLEQILAIFLDGGKDCFVIQDAKHRETYTNPLGPLTDLPIVVLVNEGSASASEIFAAVMKEQGRAIVVGEKTAGAVSVSQNRLLPYGAAMQIAIAQFLTVKGTVLEKFGVRPDIRVEETAKDFAAARDAQLEKAIEVLKIQTKK